MSRTPQVRQSKHKPASRNASLERRRIEARTREAVEIAVKKALAAERQRIAHDLHDDLGGALALLASRSTEPALRAVAGQAMANMRGLLAAYQTTDASWQAWCADQRAGIALACECAGVALHWHAEGDLPLAPSTALQLQRILREACTNALKHSGCTELHVGLQHGADAIHMRVCDNGRGLPQCAPNPPAGCAMGLAGMRLRAQRLGAAFSLENSDSGGCELRLAMN